MSNINKLTIKKAKNEKISMVTCYDYTSAQLVEATNVDCVLVGDSVAMTMHGYPDTTHATVEMMATHTRAVARGLKTKFIIGDMPFMSYRKSLSKTMSAVEQLIQAGAHCIKLEGCEGNEKTIHHIVESGIPVMGHLGLTPQLIHSLGGFKVQGKTEAAKEKIMQQARDLQAAGCFSVVLECIPESLAKAITEETDMMTIGIGSGKYTDGQVLVFQDLLGLQSSFKPKFVKQFTNGESVFIEALNQYVDEVSKQAYPSAEHVY